MEEKLLKEQQKTNELLEKLIIQNNKENELLTVEDVHNEFGIGINMVRRMFSDKELPVQRYTVPFKVTRKALNEYMSKEHDYLKNDRSWSFMIIINKAKQDSISASPKNKILLLKKNYVSYFCLLYNNILQKTSIKLKALI